MSKKTFVQKVLEGAPEEFKTMIEEAVKETVFRGVEGALKECGEEFMDGLSIGVKAYSPEGFVIEVDYPLEPSVPTMTKTFDETIDEFADYLRGDCDPDERIEYGKRAIKSLKAAITQIERSIK